MKDFANSKYQNLGFTLIELLIGIALVGIIGVLVAAIFFANSRLFSDQQTLISVTDQNILASNELTGQIRQSAKVVKTCAGCDEETTGENTLILRAWPTDPAGNPVQPTACTYDYIVYKRDTVKNTLLKQVIPHTSSARKPSTKIVATDVVSLQFSYDNSEPAKASEVTTNLKTQASTIFGKTHSFTQEGKAVLRNR